MRTGPLLAHLVMDLSLSGMQHAAGAAAEIPKAIHDVTQALDEALTPHDPIGTHPPQRPLQDREPPPEAQDQ